jgi:hypothetical protein
MPNDDPYLGYRGAAAAPHVRFDEVAAWQLLAELRMLRDRVGALAASEERLAAHAMVDWDGFTRRWFDDKHKALSDSGGRCTTALDAAIGGLQQAIERAANLQRVWDAQYFKWRAELAAARPDQPKPPPPTYPNP